MPVRFKGGKYMQVVLPTVSTKKNELRTVSPSSRYDLRISIAKTVCDDVTKMTNDTSKSLIRMVLKSSQQKRR